jgi:hypothetical protein
MITGLKNLLPGIELVLKHQNVVPLAALAVVAVLVNRMDKN